MYANLPLGATKCYPEQLFFGEYVEILVFSIVAPHLRASGVGHS